MTDYLTRTPDPTLSETRWMVIIMWAITFAIILSIFVKPTHILKPIVYPLNGAILDSEYVPGEIK